MARYVMIWLSVVLYYSYGHEHLLGSRTFDADSIGWFYIVFFVFLFAIWSCCGLHVREWLDFRFALMLDNWLSGIDNFRNIIVLVPDKVYGELKLGTGSEDNE